MFYWWARWDGWTKKNVLSIIKSPQLQQQFRTESNGRIPEIVQWSHMFQWGGLTLASRGHRAQMLWTWSPEMRVAELWSLSSDSNTDKETQRQNEPPAAWHCRPLDPLPHWYWQPCVSHKQATNNNLTVLWYCFDPWGEALVCWAYPVDWESQLQEFHTCLNRLSTFPPDHHH